jgi:hypothetical protein
MSAPMTILGGMLLGAVVTGATALLRYLAGASVPRAIEPLVVRWLNAGLDPRWFRLLLWVCFWLLASVFFVTVGFGLYKGAMGLGRDFK